jgi:hypothetical protein
MENTYNDKDWKNTVIVQKGVGRGNMHGTPWMLVPRTIPLMEEKIVRFPKISRTEENVKSSSFNTGKDPLTIPPRI